MTDDFRESFSNNIDDVSEYITEFFEYFFFKGENKEFLKLGAQSVLFVLRRSLVTVALNDLGAYREMVHAPHPQTRCGIMYSISLPRSWTW